MYNNNMLQILQRRCFSKRIQQDLNAICNIELRKMNCSEFAFGRIYDNGTAVLLYTDALISQHVLKEEIPFARDVPQEIISNQFWYIPDPHGLYGTFMHDIKNMFNSCYFADYIERFEGYSDMYCFWSVLPPFLAANQFLNMKESLEQFCYRFKDKAKNLITFISQDTFALTDSMRPNFRGLQSKEKIYGSKLNLYFAQLQHELLKVSHRTFPPLTAKEQECLKFIMLGNTALGIAQFMELSSRTVEMHLDSIRNKLGCQKKSQIIDAIIKLARNLE